MSRFKESFFFRIFLAGVFALSLMPAGPAGAQIVIDGPQSLKDVPTPVPTDVSVAGAPPQPLTNTVLKSGTDAQAALLQLGKALFWDMQVGSDGVTSCASCHFNAGADIRAKNALTPGFPGGDFTFGNPSSIIEAAFPAVGRPSTAFPGWGPNFEVQQSHFPFHERDPATQLVPRPPGPLGPPVTPADEFATVVRDTNDSVSSMGVVRNTFTGIVQGNPVDAFINSPATDPLGFNFEGQKVRAVEPVNAPTVINALFNFDNFWDGRASAIFNGRNPFGFKVNSNNQDNKVLKNVIKKGKPQLQRVDLRISNSSLASQAVGPPLSQLEMSWEGRSWADVGKKMLSLRPLALQKVDPNDSVMGALAKDAFGVPLATGLNTTYSALIQAAFQEQWWANNTQIITQTSVKPVKTKSTSRIEAVETTSTISQPLAAINPGQLKKNEFTQMMMNFPLFFGLAVQAYEMTLIADDTPFDRFKGAPNRIPKIPPDPTALTARQQRGLAIFANDPAENPNPNVPLGGCTACHRLPETTNHSVRNVGVDPNGVPQALIEAMTMGDNVVAIYDTGFYNISLRPTNEDLSRGETTPNAQSFINNKTLQPFPLSYVQLAQLKVNKLLPADVARFVPDIGVLVNSQVAVNGAFKTSSVRNLLLTGPYFHQGGDATLRQAVEFYVRGGNFPATNFTDFDPVIVGIPGLDPAQTPATAEADTQALVDFLAFGLLDARVQDEKAPFDHPQLFVPVDGTSPTLTTADFTDTTKWLTVPAVGAAGRAAGGLPPVPPFLDPLDDITLP